MDRKQLRARLLDARSSISDRIDFLKDRLSRNLSSLPLTFTLEIPSIDLLNWLEKQSLFPRVFWSSRDGRIEIAGCGEAIRVSGSDQESIGHIYSLIEEMFLASDDENACFFGGQAFGESAPSDNLWSNFGFCRYIQPAIMVRREDNRYHFTMSVALTADTIIPDALDRIENLISAADFSKDKTICEPDFELVSRTDLPGIDGWTENIDRSLQRIDVGDADKVVMARRTDMVFEEKVDPIQLLSALIRTSRNNFAFMFEPEEGHAFLGTPPERLFKRAGDSIRSEAVSGTASSDSESSGSNHGALLSSEKNIREHRFVLDHVAARLREMCHSVDCSHSLDVMKLSNVSHLYSRMSGKVREDVSLDDIISALHPTPAVCGTPTDAARKLIEELEPFERGWYAGPVGLIGRNSCEMAVAIRSALVHGKTVSFYAGAGIVPGSIAELEWREIEQKIAPALEIVAGVLV